MAWTIKYHYWYGDSYNTHKATETLEATWESLTNAKAALKRLTDHYRWLKDKDDDWRAKFERREPYTEPEWHKGLDERSVAILLDNGNPFQFGVPWYGVFEGLYSLEIVQAEDPEMRVEF